MHEIGETGNVGDVVARGNMRRKKIIGPIQIME